MSTFVSLALAESFCSINTFRHLFCQLFCRFSPLILSMAGNCFITLSTITFANNFCNCSAILPIQTLNSLELLDGHCCVWCWRIQFDCRGACVIDNFPNPAIISIVHRRVDDSAEIVNRIRCLAEKPGAYPVVFYGGFRIARQ